MTSLFKAIETDRLILRQWREGDREPFAGINADPVVMQFFPKVRTRAESDATQDKLSRHIDDFGFGFWALELRASGEFIGFTGMQHVDFEAAFTPAVEIGWRLARTRWGMGYATEAARASLKFAFEKLRLNEVVSFAVTTNIRSRNVMTQIGMEHVPGLDFTHPGIDPASPLSEHAFYRIDAARWKKSRGT